MLFTDSVYVGIDTTGGRKAFTYAALDHELNLIALADAEIEEVTAFLGGQKSATVAINAPSHVNIGLVRKNLEKPSLTPHTLRGVDMRLAEYELREHGIVISGTGSREMLCPSWVQVGFSLYRKLAKLGFKPYPDEEGSHLWLETHPHACYCILLGHLPLPKPTLEGRLQRELILFEQGVQLKDPMIFFEEITRHKLLNGVLPLELVYLPEQLDALVAAYTAWWAIKKAGEITRLGNKQEGSITLPGSSLKEKY
jgi:predicted nuclease with RNAse H fold